MGSGASQYKTKEEALAAGISEEQIAEYLKNNPAPAAAASADATKADKKAAKKQAKEDKKAAKKQAKEDKKAAKKQAKADKKAAKREKKAAKKAAKKVSFSNNKKMKSHNHERARTPGLVQNRSCTAANENARLPISPPCPCWKSPAQNRSQIATNLHCKHK